MVERKKRKEKGKRAFHKEEMGESPHEEEGDGQNKVSREEELSDLTFFQ